MAQAPCVPSAYVPEVGIVQTPDGVSPMVALLVMFIVGFFSGLAVSAALWSGKKQQISRRGARGNGNVEVDGSNVETLESFLKGREFLICKTGTKVHVRGCRHLNYNSQRYEFCSICLDTVMRDVVEGEDDLQHTEASGGDGSDRFSFKSISPHQRR
jgi:hypothetical protein